jgi:GGDEF domain-containing protein
MGHQIPPNAILDCPARGGNAIVATEVTEMCPAEAIQQSEAVRLVAQWPGAWLLDREGTIIAHGPVPTVLARALRKDVRGKAFFGEVLPRNQCQGLADTFAVAMDDPETILDLDEPLRLTLAGVGMDVRARLRRLEGLGAASALVVVEDDTSRKTMERALGAALGETGDQSLRDPETGLFGLRQFEFLLPIELRRGQRYGIQTTLLGLAPEVSVNGVFSAAHVTPDVLRELGDRVQTALRQTDVVFRFKAKHLHVVLTHTDAAGGEVASQRVHEALALAPLADGRPVRVRAAIAASGTPESPPPPMQWARQMLTDTEALLC